jgi:hypothetical protein
MILKKKLNLKKKKKTPIKAPSIMAHYNLTYTIYSNLKVMFNIKILVTLRLRLKFWIIIIIIVPYLTIEIVMGKKKKTKLNYATYNI